MEITKRSGSIRGKTLNSAHHICRTRPAVTSVSGWHVGKKRERKREKKK